MKKIDWQENIVYLVNRGFTFLGYMGDSDRGRDAWINKKGFMVSQDAVINFSHESFKSLLEEKI